jgi:hypothetical protein
MGEFDRVDTSQLITGVQMRVYFELGKYLGAVKDRKEMIPHFQKCLVIAEKIGDLKMKEKCDDEMRIIAKLI